MQTVGRGFLSTQCPVGKENSTYTECYTLPVLA